MWETDLFAKVSASDHQGVCCHYERDQKVPSWLEFWLRQTHVKWCRWGRGALWFDWVPFYTRKRGGPMYPPAAVLCVSMFNQRVHSSRSTPRADATRCWLQSQLDYYWLIDSRRSMHFITGVGSGGYAGDLTPPTIYVEGILICISPLEKPNI